MCACSFMRSVYFNRTVNLAALNKLLKTQLSETQDIVGNLNTELSLCRQQMEQELLEKDLMVIISAL